MKFVELTEAQYQAFFDSYPNAHFWQSVEMAHMRADNGWKIEYVGIADNDEVTSCGISAFKGGLSRLSCLHDPARPAG